ncbi:MAG: molybdopterin-dependent oxidoreductase [Erythrobacter sp.]
MPAAPPIDPQAIASAEYTERPVREGVTTKRVICASCDIACNVVAEVQKERVTRIRSSDNPIFRDNICMKGIIAPKGFANPTRLMKPLKRVGERGSGEWEEVSWDDAIADIGDRLKAIIAKHGPEAWAVSTSQWNTGTDHGLGRRIMNHIGTPNYISGVALCAGNTAAVSRYTYGWFPMGDFANTKCIVLMGHNPRRHSWTPMYNFIRSAQAKGAKLIVMDPRKSSSAERADIWLPLKVGSDVAMMFGWLKVIIDEELYDKDFVANWTIGFEELKERVDEFPLDRVAKLTGCNPDMIAKAARMYATEGPSIIPWTPITDMQRNSTSGIRLQGILRSICGYVDAPGGERLEGFNPDIINESVIEMHEAISEEQKAKQLGSENHPAFTYRGQDMFREPTKRVYGQEYANLVMGCHMATPSATFRAMAGEGPYPVKAFFFLGNNPMMSYANMKLIIKAMMNQDLIVAHEQFMTPSAQLADYILPADSWLERPWMMDTFSWTSTVRFSEKSMEPPGACKSTFEFWKLIAGALDRPELVPWDTIDDLYDWRLASTGKSFAQMCAETEIHFKPAEYYRYKKVGFATPTGKVELKSTGLEALGFDPLPYFREDPPVDPQYPLMLFTGVREDGFFQTGHRHIPEMRKRHPDPLAFVSPGTAKAQGLAEGEWVEVSNQLAKISIKVAIKEAMPDGLVRVPHGWWKPEMEQGAGRLSGALKYADAQLCRDDPDYLDREQGIPHLKGVPCRIDKVAGSTLEPGAEEATIGATPKAKEPAE